MFRIHKLLLFLILLGTPGEAHCPANRIVADATKRRNDTAERARLAAGAERRRIRRAASYAEDDESSEDGDSDEKDEYQTPKQQRDKRAYGNRKKDRNRGGGASRKRKPTTVKKDSVPKKRGRPISQPTIEINDVSKPVSKKRGRPVSQPGLDDSMQAEASSVTVPARRGRRPKALSQVDVDVAADQPRIQSPSTKDGRGQQSSSVIVQSDLDLGVVQLGELCLITPQRTARNPKAVDIEDEWSEVEDSMSATEDVEGPSWESSRRRADRERDERDLNRKSRDRVAKFRSREEAESDTDDSLDDIPSPRSLSPCRLGDTEECPFCSAEHYPGGRVCCDKGSVFIKPMRKYPTELEKLMFGKGVNAKKFRSHILSYNNAYSFASIQYNRIPAAAHGVQSMKVQGNPGHFPSCALPFANNDPVYGNVYLYHGQDSENMRLNVYNKLDKEIIRDLDVCMNRDNRFAHYYRNLGELIKEEEKNTAGSGNYVRMKIVNANEVDKTRLQAHKGVYRKVLQGGDHVALFFQASTEQDVKLPGLIIYPRRSKNAILPLFPWDPKATPLCYPILCPYGEYAYGHKLYSLMKGDQKKLNFRERLELYAVENLEEAKQWEVNLDATSLIGNSGPSIMVDDVGFEEIVDEEVAQHEYDAEDDLRFANEISEDSEDGEEECPKEREAGRRDAHGCKNTTAEDVVDCDMNEEDHEMDFQDAIAPAFNPIQPNDWNDDEPSGTEVQEENGRANDSHINQNEASGEAVEDTAEVDETETGENGSKKTGPLLYASLKQYVTYVYQRRKLIANRFLRGDKLGQLFLIDHFMRMLSHRYNFIREKCAEYLTSTKSKMLKARQRLADKLKLGITIGAQFSVPHTVPGSPRWLQQKFENAVAMCNAFGRPDLFVTATCNVNWPEIKSKIASGETWADHPFLVNEVFKKKLDKLMELLNGKGIDKKSRKRNKGLFGRVKWYTYSVEFQQRGPPHAHIVASLKRKPKNVVQIDKICQAVLPKNNPRLRKLVEDFMVHSPCEGNPTAYCRVGLNPSKIQCAKGFPKCFNDGTKAGDRYYPELERPNDGEHCSKNKKADNRYIVPYNTQLLTFWEGHINIEVISALSIVKYIFKYLFKGFDRALVEIATGADSLDKNAMTIDGHLVLPKNIKIPEGMLKQRREDAKKLLRKRGIPLVDKDGRPTVVYNEFWIVEDMRAVTSCEAAWDFAGYERHSASHMVVNNSIHAENEERLFYTAEGQEEMLEAIQKDDLKTKLKAWFQLNKKDSKAHDYTFADLPLGYIFEKGEWRPRKKRINNLVTRIKGVNPRYKEIYAIRLLCTNLKGIQSFEELRTVNGTVYATAVEAATALGFMNGKKEWDLCLAEASNYGNPTALRRLFCQIITNNPVTAVYTRELYEKYKVYFYANKRWEEKHLEAHALYHMHSYLAANGSTLEEHGLPSLKKEELLAEDLIDDSGGLLYTERLSKREAATLKKTMTEEQRKAFDGIIQGIQCGEQMTFFLQGSGGTGKTRIMKALFHEYRSQKKNVACVAQTGIAASLLPLGSTAHRHFKIPLSAEENMHSTLDHESNEAEYLRQLDLIIWDEATMADRRILECVHKLMTTLRYDQNNKIFGGCPFVFAGDWKQTLPVVPDAPGEGVINYTAIEWPWWKEVKVIQLTTNMRAKDDPQFAEYCAKVGSGEANIYPERRTADQLVRLPVNRLIGSTKELITKIYGDEGSPDQKRELFQKSAILAVDNKTVFDLNNKILGLLNTREHSFKSIDDYDPKNGFEALDPETYHLSTPSGYPKHELKVKVGAVVMLLRNFSVFQGLNNGTRLIVEEIGTHIIRCSPLNPERHMPAEILLHPVLFTPTGVLSREISFTRMQFPIRLAFSMTCNKAQGQTLDRCGLVLTTPCFAHGQLYVALSRVRKQEDLFIYNAAKNPCFTNNVVYRKVFGYEMSARNDSEGEISEGISKVLVPNVTEGDNLCSPGIHSDGGGSYYDGYVSERDEFESERIERRSDDPVSTLVVEQGIIPIPPTESLTIGGVPPPIHNLGNTCYANATIQVLRRIWNKKIVDFTEDNPLVFALKEILTRRGRKDASALLCGSGLPRMYRDFGVQQSAAELLTRLIDLLPPSFNQELVHVQRCFGTCTSCGSVRQIGAQDDYHPVMVLNGRMTNYDSFNDYMNSFTDPQDIDKACDTCNIYSVRHVGRWAAEIPEECRYLVVEMGLFANFGDGPVRRRQRRIGNPEPMLEIFGKVFKPIAAIWHTGPTPNNGHYKSFIEKDGVWWECNDDSIFPSRFPEEMDGVVVVVLEKVSYDERIVEEMEVDLVRPSNRVNRPTGSQQVKRLLLEQGSIVAVNADVIVNAANAELKHGGGVDGVIRSACGPSLINAATEAIRMSLPNQELAAGQVVSTDSFLLKKYKRIFHTAAPYIQPGRNPTRRQEDHLRLCYFNSLVLATREGFSSIAFPLLGIGLYNYDEQQGIAVALQAILAYFEAHPETSLNTVIIVALSYPILNRTTTLAGGKAALLLDAASAATARRKLEEKMVANNGAVSLPGVSIKVSSFVE